ncbi:MAG: epoxyqueuosine reductase, partial [Candidatus Jordarchaeum sp.]|uniref:epoxyqueuosine reductase n=1 Tax=Candidatus Jordarchaeum sp. TaxID=2823881 RepID=UPI004048F220
FLSKKDFLGHERDRFELDIKSSKISKELANWLENKGIPSKRVYSNNNYRKELPNWQLEMLPVLSHRYIAVRSGVGSFGWSGNVGIKGYGATIQLGTVVTTAELEPTEPIPPEESFCNKCKLCVSACTAGMFDKEKETSVTMGGYTFSYGARKNIMRCQLVCGGFTGLNKSGKWSTWSPGRFHIPEDEKELASVLFRAIFQYKEWPERTDGKPGFENPAAPGLNLRLTCGMCQNICWGNPEDTKENYRLLTNSGCVLQRKNGDIIILPPDKAQKVFNEFPDEHKRKYY